MSAYRLTTKVRVMRQSQPTSDFDVDSQADAIAICWAEVRQMRDAERYYAGGNIAEAVWRITMRWPEVAIKATDWIVIDETGQRFDIDGMKDPTGSAQYIELTCYTESTEIGGTRTYR